MIESVVCQEHFFSIVVKNTPENTPFDTVRMIDVLYRRYGHSEIPYDQLFFRRLEKIVDHEPKTQVGAPHPQVHNPEGKTIGPPLKKGAQVHLFPLLCNSM